MTVGGLKSLSAALRAESDGKTLRRDLVRGLRVAAKPAVTAAKSSIRAMPSSAVKSAGPPLRASIARKVSAQTRLTGRRTGVSIRARKLKDHPRQFYNAPKLTNRKRWRRMVYGNADAWVEQVGKPGWFDDAMRKNRDRYHYEVRKTLNATAKRIAQGSKG